MSDQDPIESVGVPLIALGTLGLVVCFVAQHPETADSTWRYYDAYATLYGTIPLISFGSILVGLLSIGRESGGESDA